MKLEGRTVITGAAQGVGRACAERFLAEGATVVIGDVNETRVLETAREIGSSERVLAVVTDVGKKEQVGVLVAKAVERFGRLDVMVNNAGICPIVPFLDVTEETYDKVLAVTSGEHSSARRPPAVR
jgi:NAD(P)-dependent dehydrogenase (short-subunit alcohol dehydrogenase family)